MAVLFRWLLRLAGGMIVLALMGLVVIYYLAAGSLPEYNKKIQVQGLSQPVEIVRDNANVPHIFGTVDNDVFYGLGYAHAQDRLWQMTIMRRTAQGRLSEIFGERTVGVDKLMRRLDLYPLALKSVESLTPETRNALTAYANGVNARLNEINRDALGRGAPEMFLFNAPVSPWQPGDSIALMKLMALKSSAHLQSEVLRARVSLLLPDENRLNDILPLAPGTGVAALPSYASLLPADAQPARFAAIPATAPAITQAPIAQAPIAQAPIAQAPIAQAPITRAPFTPIRPRAFAGASNAWAADATRSASGGTLLANDPHTEFTAPSTWYLARLELASGGVIGATVPGMPIVLSGRSEDLGWGITASFMDDQDLFIERQNPDAPDQYLTPTGFKPFATRKSIIRIKDAAPITLTLRWTENGPVLPGSDFDLASITPPGHVVSLGWTALSAHDRSLQAYLELMQADTVQQALASTAPYVAPSQNLTVVDGVQIAMKTIGAMPRRDAKHQSKGRLPSPGWIAENRWQGQSPYAANPEFLTPKGGILGNTNNKTVDRPFPLHVSYDWGDSQRVQRWAAPDAVAAGAYPR